MTTRLRSLLAHFPLGIVLVFALVTVVMPVTMAPPARADLCADVPVPANPWNDDLSLPFQPARNKDGGIAKDQPNTAFGDERDTTMAQMYGIDYTFVAYDASCNWGTDSLFSFAASTDTKIFKFALYPFPFADVSTKAAMTPDWRSSLDSAVQDVVKTLGKDVFNALAGLMITGAGVVILFAARRGEAANALTHTMWVIGLVGLVAVSMANPSWLTKTSDDAIMSVMETAGDAVPNSAGNLEGQTPADRVYNNLDSINTQVYYRSWLQGQLGSADGAGATKHGAALYDSLHLTWWQGRTVLDDPNGQGQKIIDAKQKKFKETVDKIEKDDPTAFEYLKGRNVNRTGTVFSAILQAYLSLPFYIVAMGAVGVALLTIRIVVMLFPLLALGGLFEPSRAWMLTVLQKYSGNIVRAPLAFVAALVNIVIVGKLFAGNMPVFGKILIAVITMVVLWSIAKPQVTPMPLMRAGGRMVRRLAMMRALGRGAGGGGRAEGAREPGDSSEQESAPGKSKAPKGWRSRTGQRPVASSTDVRGAPPVQPPSESAGPAARPDESRATIPVVPTSPSTEVVPHGRRQLSPPAAGTTALEVRQTGPGSVERGENAPGHGWVTAPRPTPQSRRAWLTPNEDAQRQDGPATPPVRQNATPPASHAESRSPENGVTPGWESGYERIEVRRGNADSGMLEPTNLFVPRRKAHSGGARSEGVSEGNTTWRNGRPEFQLWSPSGSRGDTKRGEPAA